ncbi:MAG: 50S ribosomal protein L23 [Helicobacter sp.]|uniref:50S ribosomal protein L23 n=1 Tax=Helicobacter sp. 10-6591 TaxID=2004998 RepID=UPI000DCBA488|nr:50S ribosomal protein L23 [Helicobacter sp. 10-6591]MCI6217340.1 50S ribosomal protein L23 [Helicobacter sp.]MDD7567518.1 50S ribosomal protein L23 [Helicobacter sp.]MDY5741042.1 50S ribosomal protein L23 [Helicobacter sp.]RAX54349.1 50S ribosomal protein L23 [Helicobacter sp. 10-6591]
MADIADIKAILYTEKSLAYQEAGIIVVQTADHMTKNQLKRLFIQYFGFLPIKINSLRQPGKIKKFRGKEGKRTNNKKFYIKIPESVKFDTFLVN